MRYSEDDSTLDDARDEERGYQQWKRQQYHDTPVEYHDTVNTSRAAFACEEPDTEQGGGE